MRDISYRTWIARSLARALLADVDHPGGHRLEALMARAAATLGERPLWLHAVVAPLAELPLGRWQAMDVDALAQRLLDSTLPDQGLPRIRRLILRPARMRPRPMGLDECELPDWATLEDLANGLNIPLDTLLWLSPETPLGTDHYRYRLQPKHSGALRLLEIPKVQLRQVQRTIHARLLQPVPMHEAAHGFVANRSVATHAAPHVGQDVVIKFDLQNFFGSVRAAQVLAVWRTLGYPMGVARCLTNLCTHRTADSVVQRLREDGGVSWHDAKRLRSAHLPQGAPTSPGLANLCAFGLDLRLDGLAHVFGATYTRYADDLVFSGPDPLRRQFRALQAWVQAIAHAEGFAVHPDKTRCMGQHQQQRITGVVVNAHTHTPRQDYDQLKACLHQCALHGPQSQNRAQYTDFRAHLLGRIAWVGQFNAVRGEKLMGLFRRIAWEDRVDGRVC